MTDNTTPETSAAPEAPAVMETATVDANHEAPAESAAQPANPKPEPKKPRLPQNIPIKDITGTADEYRLRPLNEDGVKEMMESIREIGLLHPITVTAVCIYNKTHSYHLRAGFHRLEACKRLGWKEIPALIAKLKGPRAELIEVDENLMQTALTPAERAKFTARRKTIYEELYPETAKGKAQGEGKKRSLSEKNGTERKVYAEIDNQAPKSFVEDTAEKTGRSKRSIELDAERGAKIPEDVMQSIEGTSLDTGQTLDELKNLSPEEQRERVKEMKAAPAKTRGGSKGKFDTKLAEQLEKDFADLWQLSVDWQKPEIRNLADRIERALAAKGIVKASERIKDSEHYLKKLKPSREQSEQNKEDKEASPPPQAANNNEALQQEAG
jgi:ParB/RepB/Spo0J family partition protein